MKIRINKNELLDSCKKAAKAIRNNLDKEHSCLKVCINDNSSYVEGCSNELNIISYLSPKEKDGNISILVDAATIINYLKGISSELIDITFEENLMIIKGQGEKVKIQTLSSKNWPEKPELKKLISIPVKSEMFKRTFHAVMQKSHDGKMENFCISWDEENVSVTALDGHRIAKRGAANIGDTHIMINSKTMMDILDFIDSDMEIIICEAGKDGYVKKAAVVRTVKEYVYIPLYDGLYFNIEKMLESINFKYSSKVNKVDILQKLSLLNSTGKPVKMWLTENGIEMMSQSSLDEIAINIAANNKCLSDEKYSGSPIGFKCSFLMDAIKSISSEEVCIKTGRNKDIIYISDPEEKDKEYVLPINLAS